MKLFVLGATGTTGASFLEQALDAGHDVTAFVRNPAALATQARDSPSLSVVVGDVTDPDQLAQAVLGHDVVISMLGSPAGPKGWRKNTIIMSSTRAITTATQSSGVRRVLIMSAFGVGDSSQLASVFNRFLYRTVLADVFRDKVEAEALLKAADLDWTLAYPVTLTKKPRTGQYDASTLSETGHLGGMPTIARADVADFLLHAAEDGTFVKETVVLRNGKGSPS